MSSSSLPEAVLWKRWREARDLDARDDLLEQYLPLVEKTLARKFRDLHAQVSPSLDVIDLQMAGNIGLLQAIERFDPQRGTKFITYAIHCIRGAILQALRDDDWMPRSVRDKARNGLPVEIHYQVSLDSLTTATGREEPNEVQIEAPGPSPLELLLATLTRQELQERLARLDDRERRVIEAYYFEGKSISEIGKEHDRSVGTIAEWKRRALLKMRQDED